MAATIAAARESFPGRRLVLAFQPHRYTRTRDLFEDFARVLSTVDALVLADVYPAGEAPIVAADGRALARAVRVAGRVEPLFVETIGEMPAAIRAVARDGDVVLTMGAGSVGSVSRSSSRRATDDAARAAPLRSAPRNADARRAARAPHELARRRERRRAVSCPPIATISPRSCGSGRARRRCTVDRARQQPARARRRRARRRRRHARPRRDARRAGRTRPTATPAPRARSSRASPRCTAAREAEFLAGIPGHRRRRARDERRLLRRRDVAARRARRDARSRRRVRDAHAAGVPHRLPDGHASTTDRRWTRSSSRRGSGSRPATRRPRGRGFASCSRSASRRSRCRCRTRAACSATRPATMRRG